jgi:hypothetical protein
VNSPAKYTLVCGLTVLWVVVVVLRLLSMTEPQQVPLRFKTGQRPSQMSITKRSSANFEVRSIRVNDRETLAAPRKNIFVMTENQKRTSQGGKVVQAKKPSPPPQAPVVTPAVPAPPPVVQAPSPTPEELAAIAARQLRELLIRQAKEQMAQYRYMGYVNREGRHQAFIGKGSEIHILDEGGKLDGKFWVTTIDGNSVTLREGQTNLEGRIELKKTQSAGSS